MQEVAAVWSLMLISRPSLRCFMLWTQTRPQPQSWSLTLRLWCTAVRQARRQISPLGREQTILLAQHPLIGPLVLDLDVFSSVSVSSGVCACTSSLFRYVDRALLSRPTYAAFMAVLDNYLRMTGQAENFNSQQLAEQETFIKEAMSNTELGRELFAFLYTKGNRSMYNADSALLIWCRVMLLLECCEVQHYVATFRRTSAPPSPVPHITHTTDKLK